MCEVSQTNWCGKNSQLEINPIRVESNLTSVIVRRNSKITINILRWGLMAIEQHDFMLVQMIHQIKNKQVTLNWDQMSCFMWVTKIFSSYNRYCQRGIQIHKDSLRFGITNHKQNFLKKIQLICRLLDNFYENFS